MTSPVDHPMRERLLHAALVLLDDEGPDALQARKVAAAADTSTMALYTHFGGMPALIAAVADEGRRQFAVAVTKPDTEDPIADLVVCGVAYRQFAIERPHLYRLMFGSAGAHGINAPAHNLLTMTRDEVRVEYAALAQLLHIIGRAMAAGRITLGSAADDTALISIATQLWTVIHGFVMLELADYLGADGYAVVPVLGTTLGHLLLALGDKPDRLLVSLGSVGWL